MTNLEILLALQVQKLEAENKLLREMAEVSANTMERAHRRIVALKAASR